MRWILHRLTFSYPKHFQLTTHTKVNVKCFVCKLPILFSSSYIMSEPHALYSPTRTTTSIYRVMSCIKKWTVQKRYKRKSWLWLKVDHKTFTDGLVNQPKNFSKNKSQKIYMINDFSGCKTLYFSLKAYIYVKCIIR